MRGLRFRPLQPRRAVLPDLLLLRCARVELLVPRPDVLLFRNSFLTSRFAVRETVVCVRAFCAALALPTIVPIADPIAFAAPIKGPSSLLCLLARAFIYILLFIFSRA